MKLTAAPTRHQGYDFVAVLVKDQAVADPTLREELLDEARAMFGVDPVLIGERRHRTFGADRAVRMLRHISLEELPWREYTLQA
jgi:hypothetical protein